MYSAEPQKVEFRESFEVVFDRPKSANFMCPSMSMKMFSGFRSLYKIFYS